MRPAHLFGGAVRSSPSLPTPCPILDCVHGSASSHMHITLAHMQANMSTCVRMRGRSEPCMGPHTEHACDRTQARSLRGMTRPTTRAAARMRCRTWITYCSDTFSGLSTVLRARSQPALTHTFGYQNARPLSSSVLSQKRTVTLHLTEGGSQSLPQALTMTQGQIRSSCWTTRCRISGLCWKTEELDACW